MFLEALLERTSLSPDSFTRGIRDEIHGGRPLCLTPLSHLSSERYDWSMKREVNLREGGIISSMLLFSLPIILGNIFQQAYNLADTLIVGRFLGAGALAAVGSAYTLMTFLNSLLIGLSMGAGALFSISYGRGDMAEMRKDIFNSTVLFSVIAVVLTAVCYLLTDRILALLQTPSELFEDEREYIKVIFSGIFFVFLYNYSSYILRSRGDSSTPLWFLIFSALLNIVLDLVFIISLNRGVKGAAEATVISEAVSGIGITVYLLLTQKDLLPRKDERKIDGRRMGTILRYSFLTSIQQSIMNFGILMIQGLVNSFGTVVMASFAAAVKIDTLAYTPSQEFGSAYSIFVSQNLGGGKTERIRKGTKGAFIVSAAFSVVISVVICVFAPVFMSFFVDSAEAEVIAGGVEYLRIEGSFYIGIGILFLLYGYYRGIGRPEWSIVLTVISLGLRVLLAYTLSPHFGETAIWRAIVIGWIAADITGLIAMRKVRMNTGK